jgi:hypothetical protein
MVGESVWLPELSMPFIVSSRFKISAIAGVEPAEEPSET